MGIIIICVGIGFLITWFDWGDFGMAFFNGMLGLFIGFLLWFLVGGLIGARLPMAEIVDEQEICALNDSTSVDGVNYLFSGYVDEDLVCRYVINTERGKHIKEVDADDVYIKEGDYTPTVKFHEFEFEKKWYYWFAHDIFTEYYVEFFVPENTVTSEYNIDLK